MHEEAGDKEKAADETCACAYGIKETEVTPQGVIEHDGMDHGS
jgi:hypothetical protein